MNTAAWVMFGIGALIHLLASLGDDDDSSKLSAIFMVLCGIFALLAARITDS